jgi:hypothetical protein
MKDFKNVTRIHEDHPRKVYQCLRALGIEVYGQERAVDSEKERKKKKRKETHSLLLFVISGAFPSDLIQFVKPSRNL